jgi:type I restriction enzyme S subunit
MSKAVESRTYTRQESVVFCKTDEEFGGLSNMAAGFPLRVNGVDILTAEALYQACRFPQLPDVQRLIIEQKSPMTAKMKSKRYRPKTREDWDAVCTRVMRWCLRVKLAQNCVRFRDLLMATGDRPIVEESKKDDFWGAFAKKDGTLVGRNVLGRLLMGLREDLKNLSCEALKRVEPIPIPEFKLYGEPIQTVQAWRMPTEPITDPDLSPLKGTLWESVSESQPVELAASPGVDHLPEPVVNNLPAAGMGEGLPVQGVGSIAADNQPPPPPPTPGKQTLHWSGPVSPQKWMDFYAKVLTRFATSPELKVEVSVEVQLDHDEAQTKADQIRSGLQELGLDDGVVLT